MARIRKPTASPPARRPAGKAGRAMPPPKQLDALPAQLRPAAAFADSKFGNRDGVLERAELDKFAAAYGSQPGYREGVLKPLEDALGERIDLRPANTPGPSRRTALAAQLTVGGGSADRIDVELVAVQIAQLPEAVLEKMAAAGLKVVAARGSVTDVRTELKGVRPRGWPPGATWDRVPGLYDPSRNQVIVATVPNGAGQRVVPPPGELHGAFDLALHETGHGLDRCRILDERGSASEAFRAAYQADRASLEAHGELYLLQEGDVGPQEAYAESFACFFAADPQMAESMPHLQAYWRAVAEGLEGQR